MRLWSASASTKRRLQPFVLGSFALAFLCAPRTTHAQETPAAPAAEERPVLFSLAMDENPLGQCGGKDALIAAVEERLHRSVFTGDNASDITIAITSEPPEGGTFRVHILAMDRLGSELGRRDVPLSSTDCAKAQGALAVVLAIMVGPPRTTTEPPWHPSPRAPEPPPEPAPAPPRKRPSKPRLPPSPERLVWSASPLVGMTGGTGVLPQFAFGLEAGAIVRPPVRNVSFIPRAAYWFARETPTVPPANVDRIGGSIVGCYDLARSGDLRIAGCAGAGVTRIEARSTSFTIPVTRSIAVSGLGEVRVGYRVPVGGHVILEPYIAPQVELVLKRDRFTYRDVSGSERTLLFPAPAAFQAGIGVAIHFL